MSECRIINSPKTGKRVQSQTWSKLLSITKSKELAEKLYSQLSSKEFLQKFGNWIDLQSVINSVKDLANQVNGYYKDLLKSNTEEALFEISMQANQDQDAKDTITRATSPQVVKIAENLYPNLELGTPFEGLYSKVLTEDGEPMVFQDEEGKPYVINNRNPNNLPVEELIQNSTKEQRIYLSETSFLTEIQPIKSGVEELFESNPELANAVYEALGYDILNIDLKINRVGNRMNVVTSSSNNKAQIDITVEDKNAYITNTFVEKVQQGFGTLSYIKLANELIKQGLILTSDLNGLDLQESGKVLWESLVSKNLAFYNSNIGRYVFSGQQAQQLYSQYLDTIFPDSKVKDIVYHGTGNLEKVKAEGFSKSKLKTGEGTNLQGAGFYFAKFKQVLSSYAKGEKGGFVQAIVNLKNPLQERNFPEFLERELNEKNVSLANVIEVGQKVDDWLSKNNKDGVIWNQISSFKEGSIEQETAREKLFGTAYNKNQKTLDVEHFSVKEPEQIHILSSKADIQGFKDFVNKPIFDKELAQKIQDKLQKLYPEINLNITNNPVWEQGGNIFNQNIEEEINNFELFEVQDKLCPNGICNYTAKQSTEYLQKIGLNPYPSNYNGSQLPVKVKSPIGNFDIEHYVSAVAVNNAIYIYDMPQNEFISNEFFGRGSDVSVKESYKPRLIALTIDEIKANYNLSTKEAGNFIHSIINQNGWEGANAAPPFRKYIENNIKNPQEYINLLETQIKDSGYEFKQWNVEEYRREIENKRNTLKTKKVTKEEEQKVIKYYENKLKLKTKEYLPKRADKFSLKTLVDSAIGRGFDSSIDFSSFENALQSLDNYLKSESFIEDLLTKTQNAEENLNSVNKSIEQVYSLSKLFASFTKQVKVYGIEEALKKYDDEQQYTIRTLLPSNVLDKYKSKEQAAFLLQKYWGNKNNIVKQLNIFKTKNFTDLITSKFKAYSTFNKYQTVLNFLKSTDFDSSYLYQVISNEAVRRYSYFNKIGNTQFQKDEFNRIIGQANIKAGTVLIDAINQKQDTLPHEYAHHYIAWFRDTPIVQEGIKKWGSEEALVQSIGEQVVKQKGEAYNWWNNFVKWIMNKFNSLSKLEKEELTQILTDAFLTRQDLGSKQDIEGFKEFINKYQNQQNISIGDKDNLEYQFKVVNNSLENIDKLNKWWNDKSITKEDFWNKFQKLTQAPKEQVSLLKETEGNNIEEKLANFLSKYSYTIKIDTTKTKMLDGTIQDAFYHKGYRWYSTEDGFFKTDGYSGLKKITEKEYLDAFFETKENNTQYYSNLTVPGGTNYTENEIATPTINPSIKGHAQFSTDNGIGWFRSDDKHAFTGFLEDLIASGTIKKVPCG